MWKFNSFIENLFWLWNNNQDIIIEELEKSYEEVIVPSYFDKHEKQDSTQLDAKVISEIDYKILAHKKKLYKFFKNKESVDILIKLWHELSPKEYEYFIAYTFEKLLWYKTFVIGGFQDWWIDIKWAKKVDWEFEYIAIQCKRWNVFNIKEKDIKQFYGSVADIKNIHWTKLFFATTNYLTRNAKIHAEKSEITCLDCFKMIEIYKQIDWNEFTAYMNEKLEKENEIKDNKFKDKIQIEVWSNKDLYSLLKDVRKNLAKENNVPAYYIFKDSTLEDMVKRKPRSKMEFLKINWIWEDKYNKYCWKFAEVIRNY